jgi:hypothetical protein
MSDVAKEYLAESQMLARCWINHAKLALHNFGLLVRTQRPQVACANTAPPRIAQGCLHEHSAPKLLVRTQRPQVSHRVACTNTAPPSCLCEHSAPKYHTGLLARAQRPHVAWEHSAPMLQLFCIVVSAVGSRMPPALIEASRREFL